MGLWLGRSCVRVIGGVLLASGLAHLSDDAAVRLDWTMIGSRPLLFGFRRVRIFTGAAPATSVSRWSGMLRRRWRADRSHLREARFMLRIPVRICPIAPGRCHGRIHQRTALAGCPIDAAGSSMAATIESSFPCTRLNRSACVNANENQSRRAGKVDCAALGSEDDERAPTSANGGRK